MTDWPILSIITFLPLLGAVVVTDGTSTINDEWQNAGLNYALENITERVSTADLIAALNG